MPEFDFHASIKRLAETTRTCPGCGLQCDCVPGTDYHCKVHHRCAGTGRIVPFVALRVPCSKGHTMICSLCLDRGWRPEPDMEKAVCHVVAHFQTGPAGDWERFIDQVFDSTAEGVSFQEAVLRTAEACVKEQQKCV